MHKRELNIIVNKEDNAIKRGDFFEEIVSNIFKTQRYTIKERVNFTGMEIDLIAQHIDRKNEIVYIECKARQSLEAKDIKSFAFNTKFKDAQYGYFLSTTDYAHQVAGLIEEMNQKKEYNNLYFWGPTKIIELLEDAKIIKEVDISKYKDFRFVKEILVYSYFGIYRVFIMQENTLNNQFTVMDAKTNKIVEDEEKIELIYNHIEEIKDLEYVNIENEKIPYDLLSEQQPVEKVAELKQSDNWFDYLPTAGKHFVGRKDLIEDFFGFLNSVRNNETDKRVFYIDGKSGWGKSSFISAIRDKSKNRYNKKKFFIFAVDTRSASTNNFIGLSLKKMIEKSIAENFINKESQSTQVEIGSNYDILNSSYIEELIKYLKSSGNSSFELPIFYDIEEDSQISYGKKAITDITIAFCETMKNAGYEVGVYSYSYWLNNYMETLRLPADYSLWGADYGTNNNGQIPSDLDKYSETYDIWQFTDKAQIDGINGYVDMNVCYKKYF